MAMLWKVPLVFVCENNGIAISVPTSKSQATPDIADRARGFGMPAAIVDGNDVLAVRDAIAEGVERARAGGGPTFVECKTVRWERHSAFSAGGSDPAEQRRAWQRGRPDSAFPERARRVGGRDERRSRRHRRGDPLEPRCALSARRRSLRRCRRPNRSTRTSLRRSSALPPVVCEGATVSAERPRGRGRASMREVADRAGVAMSSVSRVLSGHPDVSPAMSEKVMAGRRGARLPARHPGPEPAPPRDAQRRLRRRRHLEPALRRDRRRRRVDAPHERILDAVDELAR